VKRNHIKLLIPILICLFVFQSITFAFEDMPFITYAGSLDPYEIAVDSIGYVYASGPTSPPQEILQFDEGAPIGSIFDCLEVIDIAIDTDDYIYIVYEDYDSLKKATKLDPSGGFVSGGLWPIYLSNPTGIAVGKDGYVFIAENSTFAELSKFDPFGNYISDVPASMPNVDGIAAGSSYLYAYYSGIAGNIVEKFSYDLVSESEFYLPNEFTTIAIDSDGYLYIAESTEPMSDPTRLSIYNEHLAYQYEFSHVFSDIRDVTIGPDNTIYVTDSGQILKAQPSTDPGFTVTETSGNTAVCESGTTDTFTVVLDSEPASNVILNIASSDISEATIPPASLTFTPTNWNTSQTVTVTGVDDSVDDGDQTSTITLSVDPATTDTDYAGLADQTLSVTTSDDDTAGFTLSKSSLTVSESGSTDTFTLVLDSEPTDDVNFSVISTDIGEATVDTPNPTFTPTNWNMPQTITVSGVNDDLNDGDQTTSIIVSIASTTDAAYASQPPQSVSTTTTDDDATGFTLSKTAVSVDESGTSETFTVVLDCQPASDVVFDVSSSDTDEAIVDSAFLTFTSMDWSTPQDVTVTGVDDDMDDGDQTSLITLAVNDSASDDAFDSLSDQTVTATTRDDDTAGFTLSKTAVSVDESGTSETFTVLLDCQPASDVVLDIASSDSGEAAVDVLSLTFTSMTWHAPQTVTVTGVDDPFDDNDQTSIITISIDDGSSDPAFAALANQTVTATTRDDDTVGFTLSKTEVTIEESGTTDSFTIVLDTMPSAPVFFDITNTDPSEAALIPHTISFSGIDWNTPQTITVIGQDDDLVDGDQTYPIQIEVTPESATEYLTVADQFVSATTINDDVAVPVESMELDHSEVVISEGYPVTLTATITPDDATEPVILDWLSSDPGGLLINLIDNLDGTATIEAVPGAEGSVVITGAVTNYYGSASAECQVTVLKPIDYLLHIIDQCACEGTLAANGDEDKLETFISSVEEVKALIEADDLLAAQSKLDEIYKKIDGNPRPKDLVIDGSTYNLAQMILDLRDNLSVPVTGVTLNHTDLTMFIRDTETLIATITPPDAINQDLIWTTSNKLIVRVNETGVITAKKTGTAIITVTTVDGGYTASCTVTVVKP